MSQTSNIAPPDSNRRCAYCGELLDADDFLLCGQCRNCVHIKCLHNSSTPGDLCGDVFFDFTCGHCVQQQLDACASTSASSASASRPRERFVRQHLPWLLVITLALYNLSIKAKGLSHYGYFHWRTHIVNFIDKQWEYLFRPNTRRRKNWIGSVSGNLSHNSPQFFRSGQQVFNEPGWWQLSHANQTPKFIYLAYEQLSQARQKLRQEKRLSNGACTPPPPVSRSNDVPPAAKRMRHAPIASEEAAVLWPPDACSRTIPYMGRQPKVCGVKLEGVAASEAAPPTETPFNTVQSGLMDFLAENLGGAGDDDFTILQSLPVDAVVEGVGKSELFSLIESENNDEPISTTDNETREASERGREDVSCLSSDATTESDSEDDEYRPRIVQIINFQELPQQQPDLEVTASNVPEAEQVKVEIQSEDEQTDDEAAKAQPALVAPFKSLFNRRTKERAWPWLPVGTAGAQQQRVSGNMLSEYEEKDLLLKMRKIFNLETKYAFPVPPHIRRLYRKLCTRDWKRQHGKPVFNLNDYLGDEPHRAPHNKPQSAAGAPNIIDRYYQLISQTVPNATSNGSSFQSRIAGACQYELFESPYTQRVLHPFIHRNNKCFPTWLKLMCEIQHAVLDVTPQRAPIDFCYVRPNHLAAVNALLQHEFWPGIDMSECLSYPDYSVVALYKKLVVGCGFLVPDVGYNEAYISFMAVRPAWQRSGIGTFMLYHLIQTCTTKDITLHVSATNPAVVLYQRFGFKIEEIILDFYEKYLPHDSPHSRNAFFLRLSR